MRAAVMGARGSWWMWLVLAGVLGLAHWGVVALANQLEATVRALYWDPLGMGLAFGAISLRLAWWFGGPALVAIGLAQGIAGRMAGKPPSGPGPAGLPPES